MEISFSCSSVKLNMEQYNIVISPPFENQRILASAGSGKTTTITARLAYLMEQYEFDPESIFLVTFSRVASEEMQQRVKKLVGIIPKYSGTFHGLSLQLLKQYCPEKLKIEPFIDEYPYMFCEWLQTPAGYNWRKKISIIIVDEVQDINPVQWKILTTIKSPRTSMTIVGDDAQNIYTWRGSSVDYILKYHELIPNVKDYQLTLNYRSTPEIVCIANSTMRYIPTLPYKEKMTSAFSEKENTERNGELFQTPLPEIRFFFRTLDELEWVCSQIIHFLNNTKYTIAVLARYNNDITHIEDLLYKKRIPYKCLQTKDYNDITDIQQTSQQQQTPVIRTTLSTIHASKGLEWDIVFMINMNDDQFPSDKSDDILICERRLFYVGITRAKLKLFLTYSKNEKYITRFIREIPRSFFYYHSLSTFTNSIISFTHINKTLDDLIQEFSGDDWMYLRSINAIPTLSNSESLNTSLFNIIKNGGLTAKFNIPEFIKKLDSRETWIELVKLIFIREFIMPFINDENTLEQNLLTDTISRCLLTIRVYKEDYEFWCSNRNELEQTARHFLKYNPECKLLDKIQFHDLQSYMTETFPNITQQWTTKEYLKTLVILSKFRAQLLQISSKKYNIDDFDFDIISKCVPTDYRSSVLNSWYTVIDSSKSTIHIIPQLWHIASLYNISANGRNIPLYQFYEIKEAVENKEIDDFLNIIQQSVSTWALELKDESPLVFASATHPVFGPIQFDIFTNNTVYMLFFPQYYYQNISNDDKLLLLLKTYLAEEMSSHLIEFVGFINISTGIIQTFHFNDHIRSQMKLIIEYLQMKIHLRNKK